MFSSAELVVLVFVGTLGHAMALFWFVADRRNMRLCRKTIYDLPIKKEQLRRELMNSVHTPIHAVMLGLALWAGFFKSLSWPSFFWSFAITLVWAEIWHYSSHRAMHLKGLLWIHREHHKSRLNSPFTAISFSFTEKLVFNMGMIGLLILVDLLLPLNFFGIAGWYVTYLSINSFSHANFELKSDRYLELLGKVLTSTTYHSLHHSRYIKNYGLGTRFMDRWFGTEWEDYEELYSRVTIEREPLSRLGEKLGTLAKKTGRGT